MKRTGWLVRRKALNKMSVKRRRETRVYTKLRKQFLIDNPVCCCGSLAIDVHHMAGRGINFLNVCTWMALCRPCHEFVHAHGKEAREKGLLA